MPTPGGPPPRPRQRDRRHRQRHPRGERLHLTQSALSHQLRDLESRLAPQLFLRLGKRMVLTPAGERVLGAARAGARRPGAHRRRPAAMSQHGKGVLRLCTQCNTGYHWLPPLLQSFHRKFPGVDVQIVVNATDRPIEALLDGQIDLAVVTERRRRRAPRDGAAVRGRAAGRRRAVHPFAQARRTRAGRLRGRAPDRLQGRTQQQLHLHPRPRTRPASSRPGCRRCR